MLSRTHWSMAHRLFHCSRLKLVKWRDTKGLRHSARLAFDIFISYPHNVPDTYIQKNKLFSLNSFSQSYLFLQLKKMHLYFLKVIFNLILSEGC